MADYTILDEKLTLVSEMIKRNHIKDIVVDVDNTLVKANILELYLYIQEKRTAHKFIWYIWFIYFIMVWVPYYLTLDYLSRDRFQRAFYKRYLKIPISEVESSAKELFEQKYKRRFIRSTYSIITFLKEHDVKVTLLSTNIDCMVRHIASYLDVPYKCLRTKAKGKFTEVDLSELENFKFNEIKRFTPSTTIAIADSKHDLCVLKYVDFPMIVSNKKKRWMDCINNSYILVSKDLEV